MLTKLSKVLEKYEFHNTDLALLLLRLVLGVIFLVHGTPKLQNIEGTAMFFSKLGLGTFWVYVVAWVEVLGGLAMITGVLSRWAGLALAVDMAFAASLAKWPRGGYMASEFELLLLVVAMAIFFAGPGRLTAWRFFGKNN